MHKRVIIQQYYFIKKQVVIRKNIINAKANNTSKTRRFYHRILLSSWKRNIIGLYAKSVKLERHKGRKYLTLVVPSDEQY